MNKNEASAVLEKVRKGEQLTQEEEQIYLDVQRAMDVYFNRWDLEHPIEKF